MDKNIKFMVNLPNHAENKVFITGIAGFLGSHLADALIKLGYSVSGCDNLIGGSKENVPSKAKFYNLDCNNLISLKKLLKGINIVYHCAALPHEGLSVFSPNLISRNNFLITSSILTAAIHNKIKRFIYLSSMSRYGVNRVPFTEDMNPNPCDPYGINKVAGEMLVKNLCDTYGIEWVIAIPHNIIGPRQKYNDPYRNVASIMINRMLSGEQPIIYGNGEQKRCFTFIQDNVDILVESAKNPLANREIINIGGDEEFISIKELAEIIAELLHFKLKPIYSEPRLQEVYLANCSANKARRLFNYHPDIPLREGLKKMIKYIKKRGIKPFIYHLQLEIEHKAIPKIWRN